MFYGLQYSWCNMNYLSIDIGTTRCKCQLFDSDGNILEYLYQDYGFKQIEGENYVDINAVWDCVQSMIFKIAKKWQINSVCISSLGESFVLLDENDRVLFYPMLYTDRRGEDEANEIVRVIGEEKAFLITGVLPHSMYSLSKLLYIKNNYPNLFSKAKKVMLVCDYIGYKLSGERVIDYGLASRTGAFDVEKLQFSSQMLNTFGISEKLFSTPKKAGSVVGEIQLPFLKGAKLILGSHDQICASIGAGILQTGDAVDGMGTVECITTLFDKKPTNVQMGKQGYPCVPYPVDGLYCTYILNFSCGSTVSWLKNKIMHDYAGEEKDFFTYIEKDMKEEPTNLLALPYFGGASTPYQDLTAKGAFIGVTTQTSDAQLYQALMEGTAMEMRLNTETLSDYSVKVKNLVATGGGANSYKWLQIKSNIQNVPIKTLRSSEGGLCGCAMLQAVAMNDCKDLFKAREKFVKYKKEFIPNGKVHNTYESQYGKYKKLYKTLKEFF